MVSLSMKGNTLPDRVCTSPRCEETDDLAVCELCMHWVCSKHRILISEEGEHEAGLEKISSPVTGAPSAVDNTVRRYLQRFRVVTGLGQEGGS